MQITEEFIHDLKNFFINGIPCPMIYVEGGSYDRSSMKYKREQPIRKVTVPTFFMGKYLMTQNLFTEIIKAMKRKYRKKSINHIGIRKADSLSNYRETDTSWDYRGGVYHKTNGLYPRQIILRLLKRYKHQPVDLAFSHFCKLVPTYQHFFFQAELGADDGRSVRCLGDFYIDKEGIIRNRVECDGRF